MLDNWSAFKKFAFLFVSIYSLFYCTYQQSVFTFLVKPFWDWFLPIFIRLTGDSNIYVSFPNGSSDTMYNWYLVLLFIMLAVLIGSLIVVLDHKRRNYVNVLPFTVFILRYYLFLQMLIYGMAKVFVLQFPIPALDSFERTFGEASPMGLMWRFMGYSPSYSIFTGALELLGSFLLLSRKTTTLGSLIVFAVMANVLMMNLCYDVPAKLFSMNIVFFSILLIALDGKRLINFFTNRQSTSPFIIPDIVPSKWVKPKTIIKWLILVIYIGCYTYNYSIVYTKSRPSVDKLKFLKKYPLMNREFHWVQEKVHNK